MVDPQLDFVAHLHLGDVDLDGQGPRVFHRVEEDGRDLAADADAAEALVGNEGDVLAREPEHRVGGGLAARTGAHHVPDVGDEVALGLEGLQLLDGAASAGLVRLDARTGVLEHRQGVQGDVGARPGVRSGREVVGVGLAGHLEDGQLERGRDLGARGEPLAVGPALDDPLGMGIALVGQLLDVVEVVEDQEGLLERLSGGGGVGAVERLDQRLDVEAAQHGAQQLDGLFPGDEAAADGAAGEVGQELGLDLGCVVDPGRDTVGQQLDEESLLALGRVLEQGDQLGGLLRGQGQGGDPQGGTLGDVLTV
ncbi:hypothetical protein D3C86_1149830 [compost metagenome]